LTWAVALFGVGACVCLVAWLRVPALARDALIHSRQALHVMRDPALDELGRERAVQSHARQLLRLGLRITVSAVAAVALPAGVVALCGAAGWVELDAVLAQLVSPWFVLVAMLLGLAGAWLLRARRP
jgi:hypothetical protein